MEDKTDNKTIKSNEEKLKEALNREDNDPNGWKEKYEDITLGQVIDCLPDLGMFPNSPFVFTRFKETRVGMKVNVKGIWFELRYFIFQIVGRNSQPCRFSDIILNRALQNQKPKFMDTGFAKLVAFIQSDQEKTDGIYYTLSLRPL